MTTVRLPSFFVSHGGGPWPWLDGEIRQAYQPLERSLQAMLGQLAEPPRAILPRAILMVTGHWETPDFAVSAAASPGMLYDYRGFPEHTYHIRYPAPGDPVLARHVAALLQIAGLAAHSDETRGFDHGTFSVMQVMRPEADIPVVQLSVRHDMDPAAHLLAGQALAPLRDEGVLIIGSGLTYHNLRAWNAAATQPSAAFDGWLQQALVGQSGAAREAMLRDWTAAPAARLAHPREDHLLPLMVAVGAASAEPGTCIYHQDDFMGTVTASSFRFG